MGEKIPHTEDLRDVLQRGADHLKAAIDCGVTAICLAFETHQAGDQAETSARSPRRSAPAQGDDIELLTTKELARRISYSTRQIQTFKLEGMPYTGEGRNTRFELNKVVEWLKQRPQTHQKNNRVSTVGNGKIPKAPSTRLQAATQK
jgi:hypothetical protein